MNKIIFLTLCFFLVQTNTFAYLDPVSTGIIYQILFFLLAGFITFFTKLKKAISYFNKDYKNSEIFLIFLSLFPFWIILSDFDYEETIFTLLIFFIIPLILIYLIKYFFYKLDNPIFNTIIISIITIYGIDQAFGLSSIIDIMRIKDTLTRYLLYLFFFIFLVLSFLYLIKKNKRIINLVIVLLIFSNIYNLINDQKNVKYINSYENISTNFDKIKLNKDLETGTPAIVIFLDEMGGFSSLSKKIKNTKETIINSENLFKKYGFKHYPNAYSIYASTVNSIPSYLNFEYGYNYDRIKKIKKRHNDFMFYEKLISNKLFNLYDPSKIYVRQNLGLDMCSYENFKECKTLNPFSKKKNYIKNFELNKYDYIFSKFSFQSSIFAKLLTRFLNEIDLIKIIKPTLIGKVTIQQTLNELFFAADSKNYSLIVAHILAPHKPFVWADKTCNYKKYKNSNLLTKTKVAEIHNIEIQCMNKYLDKFLENLKLNGLLDYYDIIIASDHGGRNLDYNKNKTDWHSAFYVERKTDGKYNVEYDTVSTQLLFYNFFNKNKINKYEKKYFNHRTEEYIFISDKFN